MTPSPTGRSLPLRAGHAGAGCRPPRVAIHSLRGERDSMLESDLQKAQSVFNTNPQS